MAVLAHLWFVSYFVGCLVQISHYYAMGDLSAKPWFYEVRTAETEHNQDRPLSFCHFRIVPRFAISWKELVSPLKKIGFNGQDKKLYNPDSRGRTSNLEGVQVSGKMTITTLYKSYFCIYKLPGRPSSTREVAVNLSTFRASWCWWS
ncbi:hypothetical protein ACJRO7_015910 [Eucalyptus globulus]|uniref:Uncharacterized protein n=1 Tax=Eucalyptus globulus TaxID=34317 RepID=A0ABD3L673_EUCGL